MESEDARFKTILIAEDSDDLREMLRQLLEAKGYRVLEAADGDAATAEALRARPDLILMDLGLPGTDGLAAVAEIRRHIPAGELPILIISAYDRMELLTEAMNAGGSGFMAKPLDPRALLETISLLLARE